MDALLVHDAADDGRTAWFGPDPTHVAPTRAALRDLGVDSPRQGRLVDVAVRATLGTGAGIRVVPAGAGVGEDPGAILRW